MTFLPSRRNVLSDAPAMITTDLFVEFNKDVNVRFVIYF